MKFFIIAAFVFSSICYAQNERQRVVFIFDSDDNIVHMDTKILLFNKRDRSRKLEISTAEFAEYRRVKELGGNFKVAGKLYSVDDYEVLSQHDSPLNHSFTYFEEVAGRNIFEDDLKRAVSKGEEYWQRASWYAYVKALEHPVIAKNDVFKITARGHHPSSISKAIRNVLVRGGHLKNGLSHQNIWTVNWAGLPIRFKRRFGMELPYTDQNKYTSEIKGLINVKILDEVNSSPLPENATKVLSPSGREKKKLHLVGFSDDDLKTFNTVKEIFQKHIDNGRWQNLKLTLFYTGDKTVKHGIVIRPNQPPRIYSERTEFMKVMKEQYGVQECNLLLKGLFKY